FPKQSGASWRLSKKADAFSAKGDSLHSARRRHKLRIPPPAASGRQRSLRCASSPHRTRSAGLRRGPHTADNSTLTPRKVFFRRTRRRKNDFIFFRRLRAAKLCEAFSTH